MVQDPKEHARRERERYVDTNDFNEKVIAEFRANNGVVGGPLEGAPLLLLTHTGSKTGESRTIPLVYLKEGDRYIIFASAGGSDHNPGWYYNLVNQPTVTIEVGDDSIEVEATELHPPESTQLYDLQASNRPDFEAYRQATSREIPVIALTQSKS